MKLFVTRRMTPAAEAALKARFDTTFRDQIAGLTPAEAAQALRDHDAIMPMPGDQFPAAAFAGGPLRCRILGNFGVSYSHIDIDAATRAGIAVTNTPEVATEATADIALTLILMIARRASEGERLLRRGEWRGWHPMQLLGRQVSGSTVGIIGMGRMGKAIAQRCHHGFGMDVIFYNRSPVSALDIPARQVEDLGELMKLADFVVIAVPGGPHTHHLIGETELAQLGPRSYLVNIARGDIVDEAALIRALQDRRIAGAALDVYAHEPDVPEALRLLENVTLLPHLGTATEEVRTSMAMRVMDNLVAFDEGRALPDRVN